MTQTHYAQHGLFHITTNSKDGIPWLTLSGVPEMIIDNLVMTKNLYKSELFAFCIVPDHMHLIVSPGERGLSAFMHSFKRNAMRDIRNYYNVRSGRSRSSATNSLVTTNNITWQKSFHDEHILTNKQRARAMRYVHNNAFGHKLVSNPSDWPWTSLNFENLLDPLDIWIE
ncbi:MAG: transposase [Candidatus Peribacteraceae bacterium]|jgi:REP element-mobilizing transposase RayT|nr:transposase [Candidatus Peribacteraceae bacterium]HCI04121.1 hypothetical protein [Candidatus Peribacteria bacterium]|tara:strand:- start:8689 stop:9198 length:510 start_codon:yes stop_codon:yes gene_type:complete